MLDTIGKIEMITQTRTREPRPNPRMLPINGTMARIGMAWSGDQVRPERALDPRGLRHQDGDRHAEHDGDGQPEERHHGRPQDPLEQIAAHVAVEERLVDHGDGRRRRRKLGLSKTLSNSHPCNRNHSPKKMAMPSSGATMSTAPAARRGVAADDGARRIDGRHVRHGGRGRRACGGDARWSCSGLPAGRG